MTDAVPTSVHMLQNGVWTDYADHTSLDSVNGEVTVALRDGGEGDETGAADGVIEDPSGVSTSNQTITVTNASGAGAPNFTFRLERCTETTGTGCTGRDPGRHDERLEQRRRRQRRARQCVRRGSGGAQRCSSTTATTASR